MYTPEAQRRLFDLSKKILKDNAIPNPLEAAALIAALKDVITYHEHRYYVLDNPVISDYEYDMLYKKLQSLEALYPNLKTLDSPTQRVSDDLTGAFQSVPHQIPMLSLENSYNAVDLQDFDAQVKKTGSIAAETEIEYCVEPKFDGGTIVLLYENDIFVRAATRGDGKNGEEMTANARMMRSIPLRAEFSKQGIYRAELRGEALIRKDVFEKVNKKREEDGETLFANPRNAATGCLRTKHPADVAERGLEAFVYQLGYAVDKNDNNMLGKFKTHHETIALLGELGFKIPETETKICKNIAEVTDFCNAWQEKRDSYGYEIDGMVVKVNDLATQERCGFTSHHPRWAVAFKFKAKQATSKLLNIEYQVGKVGSVTPVAKLEPVQLAGVTVSSVSLHNEDFIRSKDLRIGDTVLVERAGDVIPYIVKAMEELRDGTEIPVEFPKFCPANTTEKVELVRTGTEAAWRCPNCTCGMQDLQRMIHHVSKDAMDMEGLSESTVRRFQQVGWLKNISDFYRLDYSKIAKLDGFGKRSAENIQKAVEKAKQNPIQRVLYSLCIHHLGRKVSKLLAAEINHVLDLKDWESTHFTSIKDVGPVVATNVINWFQNEKNIEILKEMERLGVNMKPTAEDKKPAAVADGVFSGKTILFTGSLSQYTRENAEKAAAAAGATIASGVSAKLNILVAGEKAGSKLKKAQSLGTVQILSEQAFIDLLK
jgi:DNA ligase (NAD+)